jgi:O-antigen ligase
MAASAPPIDQPLNGAGAHRGVGIRVETSLAWLLPFVLTTYLALAGGGYDIIVRSEIGLAIWWTLLLGLIAGVLPRTRLSRRTWWALAPLAAFLLWTWLAAGWSESEELTLAEVARVSTYLGVFLFAATLLTRPSAPALLGGIAAGIALVSGLAVLSRLIPSLFPADTASQFYVTTRLRYPFDYSDGVGEFAALGIPLLLYVATGARTIGARALGAAGLPPVLLCLFMTVSRGGILAAAVGLIAFVALVPDRIPRLATIATAALSGAILLVALLSRRGLRDQLFGVAPAGQRHSMLVILVIVSVGMAVVQAAIEQVRRRRERPGWLRVSPRGARIVTGVILGAVLLAIVVGIASGTDHRLWTQFKEPAPPTGGNQYFRLLSLAGSRRYQYWSVALDAFKSAPLKGIGPGTFQFYWAQHNTLGEFVRNAHSLWIETLAELGLIGLVLIVAFFGYILVGGSIRALRENAAERLLVATAVAGVAAFCAAAAFDWIWQIGVVPMIAMMLAAVVVSSLRDADPWPPGRRGLRVRIGLALATLPALWGIAVPLATTVAVRTSQNQANRGQLQAALASAANAQRLSPGAASPRLQRALVLEQLGDVAGAGEAINEAVQRAPNDWQLWLVASRLATEGDQPTVALADYRRARSLNPTSPIFQR